MEIGRTGIGTNLLLALVMLGAGLIFVLAFAALLIGIRRRHIEADDEVADEVPLPVRPITRERMETRVAA